jgi:hypothetical protein
VAIGKSTQRPDHILPIFPLFPRLERLRVIDVEFGKCARDNAGVGRILEQRPLERRSPEVGDVGIFENLLRVRPDEVEIEFAGVGL